jgi:hypothetical protein
MPTLAWPPFWAPGAVDGAVIDCASPLELTDALPMTAVKDLLLQLQMNAAS